MRVTSRDPANGILDFSQGLRHFTLKRYDPAADLRPWVEGYWVVEWALPAGTAHRQVNISHASINIVFEPEGPLFYGVPGRTFARVLFGAGRVFGVKFRPGGFFPFLGRSLRPLTGRVLPLASVLGPAARQWIGAMAGGDDAAQARASDTWLRERAAGRAGDGPPAATVAAESIINDRSILTVAAAAAAAGMSVRALQRLFRRELGIGPKEIIRRFRLQQAAERLLREPALACGDLALEMGYFDQAHFIRDFKSVVGAAPEEYRRRQAPRANA